MAATYSTKQVRYTPFTRGSIHEAHMKHTLSNLRANLEHTLRDGLISVYIEYVCFMRVLHACFLVQTGY